MDEKVKVGDVLYVWSGYGSSHKVVAVGRKWMMTDHYQQFSVTPDPDGSFPGKPPKNYRTSAYTAWRSSAAYEEASRIRQRRARLVTSLEQAIKSRSVTTEQLKAVAAVLNVEVPG